MTTVARFRSGTLAPFDWLGLSWPPFLAANIRTEEYIEDDTYVLRAELPGIDPAKDVRITYVDGALRLEVTRTEEQRDKLHSEFHYGAFFRTIPLPTGAKEKTIAAVYDKGILEITVEIGEPKPAEHVIPVRTIPATPATAKKN
jgi:HSP20 family protein